jgi:hypothetical protein
VLLTLFVQWEQHQCHLPNDVEGDGKADFLYTDPNLLSDKNLVRGRHSVMHRLRPETFVL